MAPTFCLNTCQPGCAFIRNLGLRSLLVGLSQNIKEMTGFEALLSRAGAGRESPDVGSVWIGSRQSWAWAPCLHDFFTGVSWGRRTPPGESQWLESPAANGPPCRLQPSVLKRPVGVRYSHRVA